MREEDGLPDNRIGNIFRASDGAVWFVGKTGISRSDSKEGVSGWTRYRASNGVRPFKGGSVTEAEDGSFWMDGDGKEVLRFRHREPAAPETDIKPAVERVSSEGNILVRWSGATKWNEVPAEDLRYKWRLNQGAWSETPETDITFTSLVPDAYRFEVFALSPSMRVDTTPAVHAFVVEPPWWRNPIVAGPGILLIIVVLFQSARVVRGKRRLASANEALSSANNELFAVNTDLKRANEEIQLQTERKSAFLASMSHELRTPMNAIKGFTNLVLRRGKDELSERNQENLQKVSQASDHLLAQINDLLDLSKIEAGKMEVDVKLFDVREMIEYCVSTVSPLVGEGVNLSADIDASVGEANTDEQRVRQMVINLLSNAVKFTEVGSVGVKVTVSEQGGGGAEAQGRGSQNLVISVTDTGKGIPEEEVATLFDEYRQVSPSQGSGGAGESMEDRTQRGTGLGLSITKRFAELLGGEIRVASVVGEGSTFTVRIPRAYES